MDQNRLTYDLPASSDVLSAAAANGGYANFTLTAGGFDGQNPEGLLMGITANFGDVAAAASFAGNSIIGDSAPKANILCPSDIPGGGNTSCDEGFPPCISADYAVWEDPVEHKTPAQVLDVPVGWGVKGTAIYAEKKTDTNVQVGVRYSRGPAQAQGYVHIGNTSAWGGYPWVGTGQATRTYRPRLQTWFVTVTQTGWQPVCSGYYPAQNCGCFRIDKQVADRFDVDEAAAQQGGQVLDDNGTFEDAWDDCLGSCTVGNSGLILNSEAPIYEKIAGKALNVEGGFCVFMCLSAFHGHSEMVRWKVEWVSGGCDHSWYYAASGKASDVERASRAFLDTGNPGTAVSNGKPVGC